MKKQTRALGCYEYKCLEEATQVRPVRMKPMGFCDRHARRRDNGILRPTILEGYEFDWEEGSKFADHVIDEDGEPNWGCAFAADPGITHCPECGVFHWREGKKVRCGMPDCGHEWEI